MSRRASRSSRRGVIACCVEVAFWQHRSGQLAVSMSSATSVRLDSGKSARKHAANIRINHRNLLAISKTEHRARRIITHARQSDKLLVCARQTIVIFVRNYARALLQTQGASRISKATPSRNNFGSGSATKRLCIRPSLHPRCPIRHHATHLRLLAHHFAHQHAPRSGATKAPWQVTGARLPE